MSQVSPAQALPEQVLEEITYHATGLRRVRKTDYSGYRPDLAKELVPFLGACSRWRSVALPIFYMDLVLTTDDEVTKFSSPSQFLHSLDDITTNKAEGFVRCATVQVSFGAILDGKLAGLLSAPTYRNSVFPSVFHLEIRLSHRNYPEEDDAVLKESSARFCERISKLFPNTKSLFFDNVDVETGEQARFLAGVIAKLTMTTTRLSAFSYVGPKNCISIQGLGRLTGLTHLNTFAQYEHSDIAELVARNASTLVDVQLRSIGADAFARLVSQPDGTCRVYPRLNKLHVWWGKYDYSGPIVCPEGVPFPVLTHLNCAGGYLFGNDILFRGNNRTLQSIELCVTPNIVQVMKKFGIFAPGRYPKLCRISFKAWGDLRIGNRLAAELLCIPFCIGPQVGVVALQFECQDLGNLVMDAIRPSTSPHSIRYLNIEGFDITALEVVEILERLRNLIDLKFSMANEGEEGRDDPPPDLALLPSLHKRHSLGSSRLRSLQFESSASNLTLQTTAALLMIASLIPSVRFVTGLWLLFKGREYITRLLSDPAFAPYASHLRSISYLPAMS